VKVDLVVVHDIVERSNVRLPGFVASSQSTLGSGCEESARVFFRHPSNGHWDQVSEGEVYQVAGRLDLRRWSDSKREYLGAKTIRFSFFSALMSQNCARLSP
jgi:hypothetical protein